MNTVDTTLDKATKASFEGAARAVKLVNDSHTVTVCWYRQVIGSMTATENGLVWNGYDTPEMEKFFGEFLPTRESDGMPQFLVNIMPENTVFEKLGIESQVDYLSSGLRFPSNTLVSGNSPFDLPFSNDYLTANLADHTDEQGVFTGSYQGKPPKSLEEDALAEELSTIWKNRYVPRYSGAEMKIPVTLQEQGELQKAISTPFTHFLKLPNEGLKEGWGVNEWMCMQLCEATGLPTAKHALIEIDDRLPPAYITERFDINDESKRGVTRRMMQDFCTLAGMRPLNDLHPDARKEGKSAGSLESCAKTLRKFSSDPEADVEALFKRSLVSYTVGDEDMHRKNISMIFRYDVQTGELIEGKMSPAYDITAEIHKRNENIEVTLPMGNKKNNIKLKTLMSCAKSMGIPEDRASEIIEDTMTKIAARAVEIANNPPELAVKTDMCKFTVHRIASIAVARTKAMGFETPEWENVDPVKVPASRQGREPPPLDMDAFKLG